ncbi:hypothetical protein [Mycobacterium camsae]|uniref:hypothetical protein n=1 Tax=Mycobacterium gordonae TaxID=1778 RepID=UPI00197F45B1|nr:hypothetical protein [Mycobacterium gordonae]
MATAEADFAVGFEPPGACCKVIPRSIVKDWREISGQWASVEDQCILSAALATAIGWPRPASSCPGAHGNMNRDDAHCAVQRDTDEPRNGEDRL